MDLDLREYAIRGIESELAELAQRTQMLTDRLAVLKRGDAPRRSPSRTVKSVETADRPVRKRQMSEDGRKRIAEAQKARWAARKASKSTPTIMVGGIPAQMDPPDEARVPMPRHVKGKKA